MCVYMRVAVVFFTVAFSLDLINLGGILSSFQSSISFFPYLEVFTMPLEYFHVSISFNSVALSQKHTSRDSFSSIMQLKCLDFS